MTTEFAQCTRHECIIISNHTAQVITPTALRRDYRCECGGKLELLPVMVDDVVMGFKAVCHHCQQEVKRLKSNTELRREQIVAYQQNFYGG